MNYAKSDIDLVPSEEIEGIICEKVNDEEAQKISTIYIPQMIGILKANNGLGLAAPQVGINKKFTIYIDYDDKEIHTIFNAKYFPNGNSRKAMLESCLSYKEREPVKVKRFKNIKILYDEWDDEEKKLVSKKKNFKGYTAVTIQHEIDHFGNGDNTLSKTIYMK